MSTIPGVIDLFAGPGGWSVACQNLGLEETGIEFDPSACQTRRAAGHKTVEADVTTLDPTWYPAEGLIASPPCQTFSTAGKGEGRQKMAHVLEAIKCGGHFPKVYRDGKTELVVEPMRWIDTVARKGYPYRWIAMEQVPTVLPVWEAYADRLRRIGYFVWVGKLHAEQYGVPQTRTRAFLLANLDWEMTPPVPTHSRYYPRTPEKLDEGVQPWVSMATALGWGMDARPAMTVCAGGTRTGGAEVFGNGARQGMNRERDAERWLLHTNTDQRPDGSRQTRSVDHPTPTLSTKSGGQWYVSRPSTSVNCDPRIAAPGRHDPAVSGSQYGPETIRVTVQEAGILQSFPADYPWQGTKTKQFEQVGNAVPPGLAEAVLRVVARPVS